MRGKGLKIPKSKNLKETPKSLVKSETSSLKSISEDDKKLDKGQRGKKRCQNTECGALVPIHSAICPACNLWEFRMNRKPKKIKEYQLGVHVYSNVKELKHDSKFNIQLDSMKYYGMQSLKNFNTQLIPNNPQKCHIMQ